MPVLIHTHGVRELDYSSMGAGDLATVDAHARAGGFDVVPSIFLDRGHIGALEKLIRAYGAQRENLASIAGFSVEGPLLGRSGGVPPRGIWSPNAQEWERIAALGPHGLRYLVMAPDGGDLDDYLEGGVTFRDVLDLFYANGVRVALGHFRHTDPHLSAERTTAAIDYLQRRYGPGPEVILTDHLFNDMPRTFRHVWRTDEDRRNRPEELRRFLAQPWTDDRLDAVLGPVPAALVRAAREDKLLPFLNFDGDHVDLEICRRTLDELGPDRLIGITDDIERADLAGEALHHRPGNDLWYRSDGIVAAGTGVFSRQRANLLRLGYHADTVERLFDRNPRRALRPLRTAASVAA